MIELDPANNETAKGIFKKMCPDSTPNIACGNSLIMDIRKEFGRDSFDVIMGNPPYNPPKTETGSSGNVIWPNFVIKSFHLLSKTGYLIFVHPPGWKKTNPRYI